MAVADSDKKPVASPRRWKVRLLVLVLLAGIIFEVCRVLLLNNVHTVLSGEIYRGASLPPGDLDRLIREKGIRTIVNLRGICYPLDWYVHQLKVVQKQGISQEDLAMSAGRMPSAHDLRRLIEVVDQAEYPLYIHCRRGADRTGVMCALALMLRKEVSLEEGRGQLHWRFGHIPIGRPAYLDRFLDLYENWLKSQGKQHSSDYLRYWILHVYDGGGPYRYQFEEVTPLQKIARVGQTLGYRVRVKNLSDQAWHFKPFAKAGIHLGYAIEDEKGTEFCKSGKAGLLDRVVGPGESIELNLVIPPFPRPGNFRLVIDLIDEKHGWFFQAGAEPYHEELIVRE